MSRHQVCDFQISMAAILKWPKIGSPSDLYLMALTFDIRGGLMSKKNLVSDFHGWGVHSNPIWPMD